MRYNGLNSQNVSKIKKKQSHKTQMWSPTHPPTNSWEFYNGSSQFSMPQHKLSIKLTDTNWEGVDDIIVTWQNQQNYNIYKTGIEITNGLFKLSNYHLPSSSQKTQKSKWKIIMIIWSYWEHKFWNNVTVHCDYVYISKYFMFLHISLSFEHFSVGL